MIDERLFVSWFEPSRFLNALVAMRLGITLAEAGVMTAVGRDLRLHEIYLELESFRRVLMVDPGVMQRVVDEMYD